MTFITHTHVKKNITKFGLHSFEESVIDLLNKSAKAYVENKLQRAAKVAKGTVIDHQHVAQSGGRVLMPSEYFGVPSNHYVETLSSNGVDMTVNNMWIRPPMDLMGPIVSGGGTKDFALPFTVFKSMLSSVSSDIKLTSAAQKTLHADLSKKLAGVLQAAARKCQNGTLSKSALVETLSMRKYAAFHHKN